MEELESGSAWSRSSSLSPRRPPGSSYLRQALINYIFAVARRPPLRPSSLILNMPSLDSTLIASRRRTSTTPRRAPSLPASGLPPARCASTWTGCWRRRREYQYREGRRRDRRRERGLLGAAHVAARDRLLRRADAASNALRSRYSREVRLGTCRADEPTARCSRTTRSSSAPASPKGVAPKVVAPSRLGDVTTFCE